MGPMLLAAATAPTTRPADSPIADGAVPTKLAGGLAWTEGATSDSNGDIYFVDQDNDRIMKWQFDKTSDDPLKGKLTTFLQPSGHSNGMCFDNSGNLIDCADERNELWSIAAPFPEAPAGGAPFTPADLKITVLIKDYQGKLLNGPNDVWVVPKGPLAGAMFIGDPFYSRKWWGAVRPKSDRKMQQPGNYVYFFSADHKTIMPVVTDLHTPNGIIGTPDGKMLYVSDITGHKTFSYSINDDGTLADKKLICNAGSDGMTIDSDGNIYTTIGSPRVGFQMWSKDGKLLDHIPIGCANCCFGGKNGNVLFICAVHEIWGVQMKTHRVGPQ
jgi:gluconolactonase